MSAHRDIDTDTTVYVRLMDDGTDVWRPVNAKRLPDGTFELAMPEGYDPENETWEFLPHARVRCASRQFSDGEIALVAIEDAR